MTTEEPKTHASESCHAYWPDSRPCYEVPYKDKKRAGEMRPTTLRDMKELGLYPGVSGILGITEKKGLRRWRDERILEAAYECRPIADETCEEWTSSVLENAEKQMSTARDRGSGCHSAVLKHFSNEDVAEEFDPLLKAAVSALKEAGLWDDLTLNGYSSERSFASPLGYGGAIDLCGEKEKWVVDWKFTLGIDKKLDYQERQSQLSAYSKLVYPFAPLDQVRLINIFICQETAKYKIIEYTTEQKLHGWELFLACKKLWEVSNRYAPNAEMGREGGEKKL